MNLKLNTPLTPISWGELIDKITILEIKERNITSQSAILNIRRELSFLSQILKDSKAENLIFKQKDLLFAVNQKLWIVEDDIRDKEFNKEFDQQFIELARSVYRLNDERARIKKEINQLLESEIVEEKSYKDFGS